MATIVFQNGTRVRFDGNPTEADIEEVAAKLGLSTPTSSRKSLLTNVEETAKRRARSIVDISGSVTKGETSFARGAFEAGGQLVGATLVDPVMNVLNTIAPKLGERLASVGIDFKKNLEEGKGFLGKIVQRIAESPDFQTLANDPVESKKLERDIEAINDYTALLTPSPAKKTFETGVSKSLKAVERGGEVAKQAIPDTTGASESLIANINRMTPTQRREFHLQQGISEEQWLRERGIIGTRQETLKELTDRFQKLREDVDIGLEEIQGTFRDPSIITVADEAASYAKSVEHPNSRRISELSERAKGEGLTTGEINEIKRFYERYIKTGYKKDPTKTSEQVQRATNRDSALREYLLKIADENEFTNLREISKEIQASKFLADNIAGNMRGVGANNAISLTDWVVIAPGIVDPKFLAGFGAKKLLSTETVRAFAAKALARFPKQKALPKIDFERIKVRAEELLKKEALNKAEQEQMALLSDELTKQGKTIGGGTRAFVIDTPIPLTRQEQTLIRAARNKIEQEQMAFYILQQRAEGKAVGEGFTIQDIDNTPILSPRDKFDLDKMQSDIQF